MNAIKNSVASAGHGKSKASQGMFAGLRTMRRKVLVIGLVTTFIIGILDFAGVFTALEYKSLDWRFRARGPRALSVPAAVVAIDDESLNGWVDEQGNYRTMPERWIWPRDFHGRLVRNLKKAGARLIVFDIVFSESSRQNPRQDLDFADAIKAAGNVILAERHVRQADNQLKTETLITPLELGKLDKGHINVGYADDNSLRSFVPLYHGSDGKPDPKKPNLDMAVARQYLFGRAEPIRLDGRVVRMGDLAVPLNGDDSVDVNFAGPPGTVPTFSYHDVYYETMDMSVFKDRVVYVGASASVLNDNKRTPYSTQWMPGVEAHVHFLDTLVSRSFIRHVGGLEQLLLLLGLGLLTTLFTFRVTAKPGAAVALLLGAGWTAAVFFSFSTFNLVLPLIGPLASILFTFGALASYRAIHEERQARQTRQLFSRYVSRQIVEEILRDPGAVKLGGELKEVTILFSDVRGFTAMSEKLSAPEVVEVLNEYLTAMVDIVIANNGTLDKYVGDAIMAVWGSPLPDPEHRQNAVRTAVQMMEVLQELQAKWAAEGKPHIDIGIGLNTGHVVAGNMGHPDYKMDFTVIGDDVNLAARMESANKELKSHILITGATYTGCENLVEVVPHPPIRVKGKEKPVEVYEIIGWKGQGRAAWAQPLP